MTPEEAVAAMAKKTSDDLFDIGGTFHEEMCVEGARTIFKNINLPALIATGMAMRKHFGDQWPEARAWDRAIRKATK